MDDHAGVGALRVTPLLTTASWTAEPDQRNVYFGRSVAPAGDVNGDGYGDVVVGAPLYENGSAQEGRAYVYLGGSSGLATSPAWTAEPDREYAWFGYSAASAGDVNGDGYGDIVVGAVDHDSDTGGTKEGHVYVYLGSSTGLTTGAAWTVLGDQMGTGFGGALASAGDVNGDGYGDLAFGAPAYANDYPYQGRAYVYLGSASGVESEAAWTVGPMGSEFAYAAFGSGVASAGDVNGDGYGDLVVGEAGYTHDQHAEGRASLYLGSASGLATSAAWTAESDQTKAYFGESLAAAGDVNGDGYGDVVVGARSYDGGFTDEGRAYVYLGSPSGLAMSAAWTAESDQTSGSFGFSVASAGDVNRDGYGDVMVGTPVFDNGSTDEGGVFVYLGSSSGLEVGASWTAESDIEGAYFGFSVASAGDVNGDGAGDVVVGAPRYSTGGVFDGRAYVYLGWPCGPDLDGDGQLTCEDCNEEDATVHPGAFETAGDGVDQDCDGAELCYLDNDNDGYAVDAATTVVSTDTDCLDTGEAMAGAPAGDCDDDNRIVHPGAVEVCDGLDDDCDGTIDVNAVDPSTWYADADGDGYVDPDVSVSGCGPFAGFAAATDAQDCDDSDADIHPGATELPDDGIDQDCDGADFLPQGSPDDLKNQQPCGCSTHTNVSGLLWWFFFGLAFVGLRTGRFRTGSYTPEFDDACGQPTGRPAPP